MELLLEPAMQGEAVERIDLGRGEKDLAQALAELWELGLQGEVLGFEDMAHE
jgi:hypothetical protein